MRRMYSEQELTKVVGDVVDSKIEDGSFDESIADYIDEYLVEHPIDITALQGKDVGCKSVTTTNDIAVGGALSVVGNASVGGNLPVTGNITGKSIIENMSGYSYTANTVSNYSITTVYAGVVKNGNKLTVALAFKITKQTGGAGAISVGTFFMPAGVLNKLIPVTIGDGAVLATKQEVALRTYSGAVDSVSCYSYISKGTYGITYNMSLDNLVVDDEYFIRVESTFLLSNSLAS